MTDQEREDYFQRKHDEVVKMLLGDVSYPVVDDNDNVHVDENWNSGKTFYDQPRIHKNMNADTSFLYEYQQEMRKNGGRYITRLETPLGEETPVIK